LAVAANRPELFNVQISGPMLRSLQRMQCILSEKCAADVAASVKSLFPANSIGGKPAKSRPGPSSKQLGSLLGEGEEAAAIVHADQAISLQAFDAGAVFVGRSAFAKEFV
jgi:hypothetical protein